MDPQSQVIYWTVHDILTRVYGIKGYTSQETLQDVHIDSFGAASGFLHNVQIELASPPIPLPTGVEGYAFSYDATTFPDVAMKLNLLSLCATMYSMCGPIYSNPKKKKKA
jgi:hypothetical protein